MVIFIAKFAFLNFGTLCYTLGIGLVVPDFL